MSHESFQSRERERLVLGDLAEFRRLRRAVEKAGSDRERAIRMFARLYAVKGPGALLPSAIRAAARALIVSVPTVSLVRCNC